MRPANRINLKHSVTIVAKEINQYTERFKSFYWINCTHFQRVLDWTIN